MRWDYLASPKAVNPVSTGKIKRGYETTVEVELEGGLGFAIDAGTIQQNPNRIEHPPCRPRAVPLL